MTRQAVTKHLKVLEEADLVVDLRRGREKLHYLNPVPIHEIAERWIGKFDAGASARARATSSKSWKERPMADSPIRLRDLHPHDAGEAVGGADRCRKPSKNTGSALPPNPTSSRARPGPSQFEDGRTADTGEILEAVPPRRLVHSLAQ